ncbi:MAG: helix-turn-helix domain-containing protein [Candidatus Sulfotelmatobacter sp.]
MGSFGEKLRQQRERRGVSLDAISNTTKISTRMLRALEDEQFDQLPGGVFNKGFVRAYARQIGLDEDEAVTDYLAALRENQVQQQAILPDLRSPAAKHGHDNGQASGPLRPTEERRKEDRRNEERRTTDDRRKQHPSAQKLKNDSLPAQASDVVPQDSSAENESAPLDESHSQVPWGLLAVALLLITSALAFWNFRRHHDRVAASTPAMASQPAMPTAQEAAPVSASTGLAAAAPEPKPSKISATSGPASPTTATTTTTSSSASAAKPIPTTPTVSKPTPSAASPSSSSPNPTNTSKNVIAAAPKPPRPFDLQIRASRTTWISIVADGRPVAQETLIAPAQTSVRATHDIVVKAGNAAGISFVLNGKEIASQGGDGEVKTYVFDATSVRMVPSNPAGAGTNR